MYIFFSVDVKIEYSLISKDVNIDEDHNEIVVVIVVSSGLYIFLGVVS
jgi:hypothetical protein